MKNHKIKLLGIIFLIGFGEISIHGMTDAKLRPQVVLTQERKKKIFEGHNAFEKEKAIQEERAMPSKGYSKQNECNPADYFIHQSDSEWGVCMSEEAVNLSGLLSGIVNGLRSAAEIGYEQSNDISLNIPLGEIGGVSPTIVIKDACNFLKQYNENKEKSKHPNLVPSLVAEVLSSYKKPMVTQSSYLYHLVNIANGLRYLDCSLDMQQAVGDVLMQDVLLDPISVTSQKGIKLLHPDLQQTFFLNFIFGYLADQMALQKKIVMNYNHYISAITCSLDGNKAFILRNPIKESKKWNDQLILWDMTDKNNMKQILLGQDILPNHLKADSIVSNLDGKMLLMSFFGSSDLIVFDLHDKEDIKKFYLNKEQEDGVLLLKARFARDGRSIIAVYSNGLIARWNMEDKSRVNILQSAYDPEIVKISGDAQMIYFKGFMDGAKLCELITINDQKEITVTPFVEGISGLSFDGKIGISWSKMQKLFDIYDMADIKNIKHTSINLPENHYIESIILMPNGKYIVCFMHEKASLNASIRLWDVEHQRWMENHFSMGFGGALLSVSNGNIVYFNSISDVKNHRITIQNLLTDAEYGRIEELILHESDQSLLLYQLCYKAKIYELEEKDEFDLLSAEQTKILEKFSAQEQNLIKNLLLKKVEPKLYTDAIDVAPQAPIDQKGYLPEWLKALWNAAYAKVFGKTEKA